MPALAYQAYFVLGLIEEEMGDREAAHRAYLSAHRHLESLRSHLRTRTRIEPITPRNSNRVEGKHGDHYCQRWEHDHVRRVKKVATSVIEHCAPAWDGHEDAEDEEAQRDSRVDRAVALRYE